MKNICGKEGFQLPSVDQLTDQAAGVWLGTVTELPKCQYCNMMGQTDTIFFYTKKGITMSYFCQVYKRGQIIKNVSLTVSDFLLPQITCACRGQRSDLNEEKQECI